MINKTLKCIDVIPSKETVTPGTFLNVLGGVINPGEANSAKIILWGKAENIWKPLLSQEVFLEEKEHRHLYFTIPPALQGNWFLLRVRQFLIPGKMMRCRTAQDSRTAM